MEYSYNRYLDYLISQQNLLVGGTTGSGKSIVLRSLILKLLADGQEELVLIDPKKVDLAPYKNTIACLYYADNLKQIYNRLKDCIDIMKRRYKRMQRLGLSQSDEVPIRIIIDEFADLMTVQPKAKKAITMLVCKLAQLGRAANIKLVIATQRPTRDIITGQIKANLTATLALRCANAQESRNLLGISGAEDLPLYGYGYLTTPQLKQELIEIGTAIFDYENFILENCKDTNIISLALNWINSYL